jgi:hypothetical protein
VPAGLFPGRISSSDNAVHSHYGDLGCEEGRLCQPSYLRRLLSNSIEFQNLHAPESAYVQYIVHCGSNPRNVRPQGRRPISADVYHATGFESCRLRSRHNVSCHESTVNRST